MRKVVTGMCEDEDLQGKEKAHTEKALCLPLTSKKNCKFPFVKGNLCL